MPFIMQYPVVPCKILSPFLSRNPPAEWIKETFSNKS